MHGNGSADGSFHLYTCWLSRGLHAASTLPFAIPINNVEMKSDQNPVAIIVRIIPATWQKKAIEIILPIPIISTSGPPKTIARVNPQKAVPTIHPTSYGSD